MASDISGGISRFIVVDRVGNKESGSPMMRQDQEASRREIAPLGNASLTRGLPHDAPMGRIRPLIIRI